MYITIKTKGHTMKKGYRFSHMELYAKIKDYLQDYKTLAEIIELAEVNRTSVIPYMRLLEDKSLVKNQYKNRLY